MASEQDDVVFDHSLDDDDDDESQSQDDDDLENDDVLANDNDDVLIEDDEEEEEEELNSPSTSSPITTTTTTTTITASSVKPAITVAVPIATPSSISAVTIAAVPNGNEPGPGPDPKRPRIGETLIVQPEEKKPASFDESRRLFQRLWTDEDEIELLQGFLDYTTTRGSAHHHDTALFYDQIKSKLQLEFNKNQLVEKLRRLKKKYRNVISKISSGKEFNFKSAHDQATFEISRKIWSNNGATKGSVDDTVLDDEEVNLNPSFSNVVEVKSEDFVNDKKTISSTTTNTTTAPRSRKRSRSKSGVKIDEIVSINENNGGASGGGGNGGGGNGVVEETVRSCLTPLFKELLSGAMMMGGVGGGGGGGGGMCGGRGIGGLAMNAMPLSFGMPAMMMSSSFGSGGEVVDERWRKQQILELEVYSKRLELVQDQIKVALEDLRNMGG